MHPSLCSYAPNAGILYAEKLTLCHQLWSIQHGRHDAAYVIEAIDF